MRKFHCYVDETGLDVASEAFIVGIVIVEGSHELLANQLVEIEKTSRKGRRKWLDAREEQRVSYMSQICDLAGFQRRLIYGVHQGVRDFRTATLITVANAIRAYASDSYKASVFIDGLPKSQVRPAGAQLRKQGISTEKVRGVRDEDSDPFMRLADSVCGFVRAARTGNPELRRLFERIRQEGSILEV